MDLRDARPAPPESTSPERRWTLFVSQLAVGVGGVIAFAVALIFTISGFGLRTVPNATMLGFLVLAGIVAGTFWFLAALERQKYPRQGSPAPSDPALVEQLTTSRREIVGAFEIERRRIERDLHDGAQQYLVASSMKVGEVALLIDNARSRPADAQRILAQAADLVAKAQDDTDEALRALRRTVSGIHPKVLSDMGLEAAVRDMAGRVSEDIVVRVPHPLPRLPEGVVAAAYFFVSEAITNAAKHAPGAPVSVLITADQHLQVSIVDEGPGGAEIRPGHGLSGMRERLAAFGGTLEVSSPPGGPTAVRASIPLLLHRGESGVVPFVQPAAGPGAPTAAPGARASDPIPHRPTEEDPR